MQKPTLILTRFTLALAIAALPALAFGQSGAMSNSSNSMGQQSNMANTSGNTQLAPVDQTFVRKASQGNQAEVELGKMAAEKTTNPQVKQFAERMIRDHSKAEEQLQQVAQAQGVELPIEPDAQAKMTKKELADLSGDQFDKAYMSDMLKDHKQDIAEFRREEHSGSNPQVKEFAQKTLPILESHLREAEKVAPQTGVATNSGMKGSE